MISNHLKTNFVVGLYSLDCTADFESSSTFSEPLTKTETAFSSFCLWYLFNASIRLCLPYLLPTHVK